MKNIQLFLKKLTWLERVWLAGPVAVWFSYQPLVRLAEDATSYYELSIALIYIFVLALVGIPAVWRARRLLARYAATWIVGSFVLLSALSLVWTPNLTRGILTVGIVGLLYLIVLATLAERERLKKLLPTLGTILVSSAVVVSVFSLLQIVAGIWLPRTDVLLCAGCGADQFGFVRPNGFAIEPQFLGSLLIAPLLILLNNFFREKRSLVALTSFVLLASTLFMTLSRGAIFAFAFAVLVLFALNFRKVKYILEATTSLTVAFAIALAIQGTAAALNPRVDVTFYGAVSSSISQLSLGTIRLPAEQIPVQATNEVEPVFDGYVPESTDTRLSLAQLALETWKTTPQTMLFGVGVGGTGAAVHATYPEKIDAREIVQNQYVEILLEYGLVGLGLFVAILAGYMWSTRASRWVWTFLLAYAVQWWFFSGYPNALHVYLVLFVLFAVFGAKLSERRA